MNIEVYSEVTLRDRDRRELYDGKSARVEYIRRDRATGTVVAGVIWDGDVGEIVYPLHELISVDDLRKIDGWDPNGKSK